MKSCQLEAKAEGVGYNQSDAVQNDHTNAYRSTAIRFAAIALCCWCCLSTVAQDSHTRGIRYYGTTGLRQVVPDSQSKLESVDIVYGTTLTEDNVSFLSTCKNVIELSIGGNLSDEFVTFEGSLSELAGMEGLRRVFLCKEKMQDEDLEFIAKLPRIEYLEYLADTNPYGKAGPVVTDMLASRCVKLKWLSLYSNRFTDRGVQHLAKAKNLEMNNLRCLGIIQLWRLPF